ncbi:MAG: hypothetical protein ACUVWP_06680 [bacterium]
MKDIIEKRESLREEIMVFVYVSNANIIPFQYISKDEIMEGVRDILNTIKNWEAEFNYAIEYLCDKKYLIRERRRSDGLPLGHYAITANGIDFAENIIKEKK